jgi:hypothetical protein
MAGLVGGLGLNLHNPVPHALFAIPWLVWLLTRKDRWTVVPAMLAGYLPWVAVGFGWRHLLQGLAGGTASAGTASGGSSLDDALTLLAGAISLPGSARLFERVLGLGKFWLWAAPGMALLACIGFWLHRGQLALRLLLTSLAVTFAGFVFVPLTQGHGWGFRYLHSAWFVVPVLAAAAFAPSARDSRTEPSWDVRPLANWARAAALAGLLIMVPGFAWRVHTYVAGHLAQLPQADHGRPRVLLISPYGYFSFDLVQNDPFLRDPLIHMVSYGQAADAQMMQQYYPDLVKLSESSRGSVWGYADPPNSGSHTQP